MLFLIAAIVISEAQVSARPQLVPPASVAEFETRGLPMSAVAIHPEGTVLASGNARGEITLWDIHSRSKIRTIATSSKGTTCLKFSPDGKYLVSACADMGVRIWTSGQWESTWSIDWKGGHVKCLAFTPDGRLLLGGRDGTFEVWHLGGRRRLYRRTFSAGVECIDADDDAVAVATRREVIIFDPRKFVPLQVSSFPRAHSVVLVGRHLGASGFYLPYIEIHNLANPGSANQLPVGNRVISSVANLGDDRHLVTGTDIGGWLSVWDLSTGGLVNQFRAHTRSLTAISTARTAGLLATSGLDGKIKVWNVASLLQPVQTAP